MLYLFDVYALVVGTVAVVALAAWLTFYAFLLGCAAIVRRLRVAELNATVLKYGPFQPGGTGDGDIRSLNVFG